MLGQECTIWDLSLVSHKRIKRIESNLPNHHSRGGQSQNRMMRLREQAHDAYVKYVAEWVQTHVPRERALLIAGFSTKPIDLVRSLSQYRILETLVVQKEDEAVQQSLQYLSDHEQWKPEMQLWNRFLEEWNRLSRNLPSKAVYGKEETLRALENQELELCLVHESVVKDSELPLNHDVVQWLKKPHHDVLNLCGGWCGIRFYAASDDAM